MPLLNPLALEAFNKMLPPPPAQQSLPGQAPRQQSLPGQYKPQSNQSLSLSGEAKMVNNSMVDLKSNNGVFSNQSIFDLIKNPIQGNFTFTSEMGERNVPRGTKAFNQTTPGKQFHNGVDLAAPKGTPIAAQTNGTVIEANSNKGGYGNQILIKSTTPDGQDFYQRFAHLDVIDPSVKVGSQINLGQQIGKVGSTGNSTGPHLHYEVFQVDDKKKKSFLNINDIFRKKR